jgi:2-methylfumaryl-CoA isomerase
LSVKLSQLLSGVRIIECASFVAGPFGCMSLAQMGAEVIRIDPLRGGPDFKRWPMSQRADSSLFWTGLNRGKKSLTIDTRSAEGRELVLALATAPGPGNGILIDNQVGRSWLEYENLASRRSDAIQVRIGGSASGGAAVDYTVNPSVGVPSITGPKSHSEPVNNSLPAWDLLTGMTATTALLAALRHREQTGAGSELNISLEDVALAGMAGMGWYTEAEELNDARGKVGNYLYGSFGINFRTKDGQQIMVVALTGRQWSALLEATGTGAVIAALEASLPADFTREGDRFTHREILTALLRPWFAERDAATVATALDDASVLWSQYRSLGEVARDFRKGNESAVLTETNQPGIGPVISAHSPIRTTDNYESSATAPQLAEHTDEVLSELLGLSSAQLGRLHDEKIIGGTK